jgi:galactokinase
MTRAELVARAPGRVNLIGDHTDYTGGLCLPIAINRWVEIAGRPQPHSRKIALASDAEEAAAEIPIDVDDVATVEPKWARYVAAVVKRLRPVHGFVGVVRSDLPIGAGLSSSAALEIATALALGAATLDPLTLAKLCRDAEHEARGVPTGLLDQLASALGVADHALLIDCSTNTVTPTPLPPSGEAEFIVIPGTPRILADTGYAERVEECRRAEAEIGPLRAATSADVQQLTDPTLRRRARHVVSENNRVRAFATALAAGHLRDAGQLMQASHRSLRDDYACSTPTIDSLCDELQSRTDVFGARMTGGGWGGSVVALVRPGTLTDRCWPVRAVAGAALHPDGVERTHRIEDQGIEPTRVQSSQPRVR